MFKNNLLLIGKLSEKFISSMFDVMTLSRSMKWGKNIKRTRRISSHRDQISLGLFRERGNKANRVCRTMNLRESHMFSLFCLFSAASVFLARDQDGQSRVGNITPSCHLAE